MKIAKLLFILLYVIALSNSKKGFSEIVENFVEAFRKAAKSTKSASKASGVVKRTPSEPSDSLAWSRNLG